MMMKNITSRFGVSKFILLLILFIFTGCHKNNNGVIEVHKYSLDFEGDKIEGSDTYSCYIVSEKSISLNDAELVTVSDHIQGYSTFISEYVYWESESAKSLGYNVKVKGESSENILGYQTNKVRFVADDDRQPGANGYWGIDLINDGSNSGSGTVVFYLATNTSSQAFNILVDGISQKDGSGITKNLYDAVSTPNCSTVEIGPDPGLPSWNVYNIIKVNVTAGTHSWQAPSSSSQENYTGSFSIESGGCKVIKVK